MAKLLKIKILLMLIWPLAGQAQYLEIGAYGGGTQFLGDVGPYRPDLPQGYSYGGFFRYVFDDHWALKAQVSQARIQAEDARSTFDYRQERNLSFRSDISEIFTAVEFNFFSFEPGTQRKATPYVFLGAGVFWFDPQASLDGEWYRLQPLRTEGQSTEANEDLPYGLGSRFILMGLGYRWALNRHVSLAIDLGFRRTYTDYLDDVSGFYADPKTLQEQVGELSVRLADRSLSAGPKENRLRGNPATTDWYIFTGLSLQVKFNTAYEKCRAFLGDY